jgi:hypothetical protein
MYQSHLSHVSHVIIDSVYQVIYILEILERFVFETDTHPFLVSRRILLWYTNVAHLLPSTTVFTYTDCLSISIS